MVMNDGTGNGPQSKIKKVKVFIKICLLWPRVEAITSEEESS
jgi:hypothetical protein